MDLDEAVTELYGLSPDAFLEARRALAARAKAAKDTGLAKAVASVRKPTAAAWSVNQLVRRRPDELDQLVELAAALQDAQERMDGAALKTLGRRRTTLVDTLVRATAEVAQDAGGSLSGAVGNQVRETFVAALASAPAAQAVASGQLTRALSYAGFGDVDLDEATASPSPARRPALRVITGEGQDPAPPRHRPGQAAGRNRTPEAEEAEPEEPAEPDEPDEPAEPAVKPDPALRQRLRAAEKRSRETMSTASEAGDALSSASEALDALDARIADLDAALKEARAQRPGLLKARTEAVAADKTAGRTLRAALAEVDQIRALVPDGDDG